MRVCARTVEWQDTGQTCRCVYAEGHIGPHSDGLHGFDRYGLRTPREPSSGNRPHPDTT